MKTNLERRSFLIQMHEIEIADSEVSEAWNLILNAVESLYITPQQALDSLFALHGDEDNGLSWDEFGTGADLDHWNGNCYDFTRVCVYFASQKSYCSRSGLLQAYHNLLKRL